jgi:prepilin-type N-terminal cleavage/methylation domain-containing protein
VEREPSAQRDEGSRGVTLVESLVGLLLLGIAAVAILPAFLSQTDSNSRNELRTAAVSAVSQRLEELRREDPAEMPSTGTSAAQSIIVGVWDFEVFTQYCARPILCNATSRHLVVEARLGGRKLYDVETVFTQIE